MKFSLACAAGLSLCGALVASSATIPASSYIQKGLVANWDAIENGGVGVHGDVATSGWTDLVGGCVLTTNVTADGVATTTATGVHLYKTSLRAYDEGGKVTTIANVVGSAEHTIEIAGMDTGTAGAGWLSFRSADNGTRAEPDRIFYLYNESSKSMSSVSRKNYYATNLGFSFTANVPFTHSMSTTDGQTYTKYSNGAYGYTSKLGAKVVQTVTKAGLVLHGNAYVGGPNTGTDPTYSSVRIYSRALTADEIKWNRIIDRIRFEGADPAAVLPAGYRCNDEESRLEFLVKAQATDGGTIRIGEAEPKDVDAKWCAIGTDEAVTLTATAATGWSFVEWTGDVKDLDVTSAAVTLPDTTPRTLQAKFLPTGTVGAAVTIDRFRQRYPWNGLVDIDYTVSGVTEERAETLWLEFSVTSGTGVATKTVIASNFVKAVWCDLPVTNGSYHIVWDSAADGVTLQALNGTAKARLYSRTVAEKDATYAIVDVSAGKNATRYPIRYVDGGENLSPCFNCDEYLLNKMVLKRVKAGEFWMGVGNVASGTARHRVRLTEDYFCGLFPVSRKQFERLTGASHNQSKADRNPAEALSWNHIHNGYNASEPSALAMLNQKVQVAGGTTPAGLFALPTEAQWEYACRAGTETKWYFGNTKPSDWDTKWAQMTGTYSTTLGKREPNPWGFYDFYGNAGEWCEDWSESTTEAGSTVDYPVYSAVEVTENPLKTTGERRVIRGLPSSNNLSSGYRWTFTPERTSYANLGQGYFGFRVVRTVGTTVAATAESAVTEAERAVSLDLTEAAVRKLLDISELLPLVYNSTNSWARGGDADVTATLAYVQMAGDRDADPSEWTAGDAQELLTAAGEGAYVWTPPIRGLYKVMLTVGESVQTAYYDLIDTEGVAAGKPIDGFELTLSVDAVPITGGPVRPEVTLKDGDTTLVEGVDYAVSCLGNVGIGTATLKVTGIGDYTGEIVRTFRVVDAAPESKATDETVAGPVDLRTNAVLRVVVSRQDLLPVAANDSVLWPIGGLMDADKCYAVLSYAPMASKDAEPDETQRVELPQIHGETTETIKLTGGYWQLKLSIWNWVLYDRSYQLWGWRETSTLTRVVYYRDGGMVILVK